MMNTFTNSWYYDLSQSANSILISFNERLIAIINKSASGKWPVHATINEKTYLFSKKGLLLNTIEVKDTATGNVAGTIHIPFLFLFRKPARFIGMEGSRFNWHNNNFFSFHWKWKSDGETLVDAIDHTAGKKNKGVIAFNDYKTGTDLLVVSGFLLSVLKRKRLIFRLTGGTV